MASDIVITGAARTAVGSFSGVFATVPGHELGAAAIQHIGAGVEACDVVARIQQRDERASGPTGRLQDLACDPRQPVQVKGGVGQGADRFVDIIDLCGDRAVAVDAGIAVGRHVALTVRHDCALAGKPSQCGLASVFLVM